MNDPLDSHKDLKTANLLPNRYNGMKDGSHYCGEREGLEGTRGVVMDQVERPRFVYQVRNEVAGATIRYDSVCICCAIWEGSTKYISYRLYILYMDRMLGENSWYAEPDKGREPWVILILETNGERIVGWQMGFGNSQTITRINRIRKNVNEEGEVLKELLKEIRDCKQGERTTLITYAQGTLPLLRSRILQLGIKGASFRGLQHLCVESLLNQHFEGGNERAGTDQDPKALWELFTRIGPLVPRRALEGKLL